MITLLVTGSRTWKHQEFLETRVWDVLGRVTDSWLDPVYLRHGGAAGADSYASVLCRAHPWKFSEQVYLPDYPTHGNAAPLLRDMEMVDDGAEACVAFIRDNSRGATFTANRAFMMKIPVWEYHYNSDRDTMKAYYRSNKEGIDERPIGTQG